jgi:hypothetical protein
MKLIQRHINLLSICSLVLLSAYLLLFRMDIFIPELIFWISFISTLIFLLLECTSYVDINVLSLLVKLTLFVWLLKSIFIPKSVVPFFGSDSYVTFSAINDIQRNGWLSYLPWDKNTANEFVHQRNYPFVPEFSLGIVDFSGSDLIEWGRWGILSLSIVSVWIVYDISLYVYKKKNSAIVGAVGFGLTYYYLMFHSQFVYEAIAFVLFLITINSLLRSQYENRLSWRLIAIISATTLIFTHHLTAILLAVFLLLYNVIKLISTKTTQCWSFLLFYSTQLLTYWTYLHYSPLKIAANLIQDAFKESSIISITNVYAPTTSRFYITLVTQGISALLFGGLALYHYFKSKESKNSKEWSTISVLWGGSLGFFTILGIIGLFGKLNSFPSRMEIFGYAFLIPLAAHSTNLEVKNITIIKIITITAILLHGTSSIIRTAPYLYSQREPDLSAGEVRALWFTDEYHLISKLRSDIIGISGDSFRRSNTAMNIQASYIGSPEGKAKYISNNYDYIITGKQDHFNLTSEIRLIINSPALSKIYDAGWTELYVKPFKDISWNIDSILFDTMNQSQSNLSIQNNASAVNWLNWMVTIFTLFSFSLFPFLLIINITSQNNLKDNSLRVGEIGIGIIFGLIIVAGCSLSYEFTKIPIRIVEPSALLILILVFLRLLNKKNIRKILFTNTILLLLVPSTLIFGALFQNMSLQQEENPIEFFLVEYSYSSITNTAQFTLGVNYNGIQSTDFSIETRIDDKTVSSPISFEALPNKTIIKKFFLQFPIDHNSLYPVYFILKSKTPLKSEYNLHIILGG